MQMNGNGPAEHSDLTTHDWSPGHPA